MKFIANCVVGDSSVREEADEYDGRGGAVVLVGLRLDASSRGLLTWALVNVARSGDRVIALHVLDPQTGNEGKSTLISLVQTFDSVVAAYEGFCSLKQVDLKLKVCRGSSLRKVLVQEAKSYATAKVIVGASKVHQIRRSGVSIAKYCARNLPKKFSVFAVRNGKILYQRKASDSIFCATQGLISGTDQGKGHVVSCPQSLSKRTKLLNNAKPDAASSKSKGGQQHYLQEFSREESLNGGKKDSSKDLMADKSQPLPVSKNGWVLLRRGFLHNQQASDKLSLKKFMMQWVLKFHSRQSLVTACPEHKQNKSDINEDHSLNLENGAAVSCGTGNVSFPSSPTHCLESYSEELAVLSKMYSSVCRLFSYQELLCATHNFRHDNLVGKGGSSRVFRGCLADGKEVAVKVLKPSKNAFKEFSQEIEIITTLHHKNIISLLGFCSENYNLLLVYDFLSRGSLEENLDSHRNNAIVFGWESRYKVVLGVAKALDHLHNTAAEPIIHRDVKSSNILLSGNFEPKLSDFGLAMWASDSSYQMTSIDCAGTFGYLAPEYFMHGKVDDRIDVYAFGVVLLELLSGRKPIENQNPKGQESLVMWAQSIVSGGEVSQLLDPSLGGNYDHDQSERMILAAVLCIRHAPQIRPQINLILKLLLGDAEVTDWARQEVNALEDVDDVNGEGFPANIQSHLNMALLNIEEDSHSDGRPDQTVSVEDYSKGRCCSSSSSEKPFLGG
ncbi:Non-specific serine/threonine protein kinase [Bertholletia excelsa]